MSSNLETISKWIDDRCRRFDMESQRLCAGPLTHWGIHRENFEAFLWPSLIAAAMWTGMPTFNLLQLVGLAIGVFTLWILIYLNRKCSTPWGDLLAQMLFLYTLGIVVFIFGPSEAGTGSLFYRHVLIPIVFTVGLALLLACFFAGQLLRPLQARSQYGRYLKRTELFQSGGTRLPLANRRLPRAVLIVISILLRPLELLLPTSVAILISPPVYVNFSALIVFFLIAIILFLAALNDRFDSSLRLLMRRFIRNAGLVVTLLIIAFAFARLSHNLYVTTVFDSASGQEILLYFLFAYSIAWWYDYWTERIIGQQLFRLIFPGFQGQCSAPYNYAGGPFTSVPRDERCIELHGQGRILVYRPNPANPQWAYFQAWSYTEFFTQLAAVGAPGGKAVPLPQQINQRLTLYLGSTALVALAILAGGGWYLGSLPKHFELSASTNHSSGLRLASLLEVSANDVNHPAILVSASGGGTRAAVFAGAVLEGLSETQGANIRAGSGVSGGSAGLAYYAAMRPQLIKGESQPWNTYFDVMTEPFIRDVIERFQEWRMAEQGRMGILLAESFERRWKLRPDRESFSHVPDFGMIFNSTLAGRFDRSFLSPEENDNLTLAQADARYGSRSKSDVAGGRLIMTNLDLHRTFSDPSALPFLPGEPLPVLVDDNRIRVERAAALSANFPPVFSNAAVDVDDQHRYWVTDGGAADNRGLEPLLYALRDAVNNDYPKSARLPSVAVVVIEASGIDESFEQTRGVSSALGAGAHFADQLDKELADNLSAAYQAAGQESDLHFYYIPMPNLLRTSGSFGTHWMLQGSIDVKNGSQKKTFKGIQVVRALRAAYGCREAGDSAELVDWIVQSKEFEKWCVLRKGLLAAGGSAPCGCGP